VFHTYENANGETVTQLDAEYMYVIPTKITRVYSLTSNGEKTLLKENPPEEADMNSGVYISTSAINKLFSDTHKLLRGEQIDKMGAT
jgi:hypothetical protein